MFVIAFYQEYKFTLALLLRRKNQQKPSNMENLDGTQFITV